MHGKIGKELKNLSKTWILMMVVAIGLVFWRYISNDGDLVLGICFVAFALFFAWVSACILYGFGELIEKVQNIDRNIGKNTKTAAHQKNVMAEEKNTSECSVDQVKNQPVS